MRLGICVIVLLCSISSAERTLFENYTVVETSLGSVVGAIENGYRVFKGIPYAAPPTEQNRWAPPLPVSAWNGELNATQFPVACPQHTSGSLAMSEDCLYLNIWAPLLSKLPNNKTVPVMVWIHGGDFWIGWSGDTNFYGDYLVNMTSNTIIITINYRLGALGFFNSPDLEGNYGFQDQQMALIWVQDHISSFGGDPSRVTIFGQSAGAMSVLLHTLSPSSAGLFSRAISESNVGLNYRTSEENYPYSEKVSGILGCNFTDLECLRSQSWENIVEAQLRGYMINIPITTTEFLPYCPIIDGTIIPEQPMDLFRAGHVNTDIDAIIFGVNRNETLAFVPTIFPVPAWLYNTIVRAIFAENSTKVLNQYPPSHRESNFNLFSILSTDWVFLCANRFAANAFVNSGISTYFYNFMHPPTNDPINRSPPCKGAVCHSAEISFVHNSVNFDSHGSFTPTEHALAWRFISYWLDFAHDKMDNPTFGLKWPLFNSTDFSLAFDLPENYYLPDYHSQECNFWDSLGYYN